MINKKIDKHSIGSFLILVLGSEIVFWTIFFICVKTNFIIKDEVLFVEPQRLLALFVVLVVLILTASSLIRKKRFEHSIGKMSHKTIVKYPSSGVCYFRRFLWIRNSLVFFIIAWAEPFFGTKKVSSDSKKMEIVVCLDVSNSMNVCDIDPKVSRLEVAKRAIKALIDQLEGEKIGVSIFAGNAYTYLPLTTDYEGAKVFINDISTALVSTQGTNVKIALYEAYNMFSKDKNMPKTVLLITDGGNHEESPTIIFKRYQKQKIQFLVLGIGTLKGGLMPIDPNDISLGYKRDAKGTTVVSKLNVQFVKHIANLGKGEFMLSYQTYPDLRTLLKKIKRNKQVTTQQIEIDIKEQRYLLPLILSLLCYIGWILDRKRNIKIRKHKNKLNLHRETQLYNNSNKKKEYEKI